MNESLCRGKAEAYEYKAVPGRLWVSKRDAAQQLCIGCPFGQQRCARRALECDSRGMVWAGVPVPESYSHGQMQTALAELRRIAGYVQL